MSKVFDTKNIGNLKVLGSYYLRFEQFLGLKESKVENQFWFKNILVQIEFSIYETFLVKTNLDQKEIWGEKKF